VIVDVGIVSFRRLRMCFPSGAASESQWLAALVLVNNFCGSYYGLYPNVFSRVLGRRHQSTTMVWPSNRKILHSMI